LDSAVAPRAISPEKDVKTRSERVLRNHISTKEGYGEFHLKKALTFNDFAVKLRGGTSQKRLIFRVESEAGE